MQRYIPYVKKHFTCKDIYTQYVKIHPYVKIPFIYKETFQVEIPFICKDTFHM